MTTENLLADLGLDLGAGTAASNEVAAENAAGAAAAEKAKRSQIDVGTIAFGEEEDIPVLVRTFSGERKTGSKYKFAEIEAPVAKDGGGFKYKPMIIELGENDHEAFRRSVQSATTQANNAFKEGEDQRRFITRSFNDAAGKFAGMKVYRVDNTLAAE